MCIYTRIYIYRYVYVYVCLHKYRTGQKAQWTHRDFVRDLCPMSDEVSLPRLDTPVFPSCVHTNEYVYIDI